MEKSKRFIAWKLFWSESDFRGRLFPDKSKTDSESRTSEAGAWKEIHIYEDISFKAFGIGREITLSIIFGRKQRPDLLRTFEYLTKAKLCIGIPAHIVDIPLRDVEPERWLVESQTCITVRAVHCKIALTSGRRQRYCFKCFTITPLKNILYRDNSDILRATQWGRNFTMAFSASSRP